jgi:hypothetical protein
MAHRSEIGLPLLDEISAEQHIVADDREAIRLAEILVRSGVAITEDWGAKRAKPYQIPTVDPSAMGQHSRWAAIGRRFDLDLTLSDRLIDYSDARDPEGTLYLTVDPESAAFVLFNRTIERLAQAHPRLPSTFFHHFVGALNRWVRVYDFCCRQQKSYFVAVSVMWRRD